MQVDPLKPPLKAPGAKRLKLKYHEPPSRFASKFNLRRYPEGGGFTLDGIAAAYPGYAGVYPLTATAEGHASVTLVGRCRLPPG